LFWAVVKGHESAISLLLARGASPANTDRNGFTALAWSILCGSEPMVALLLGQDVFSDIVSGPGATYPHVAAFTGNTRIMQTLIERGFSLNVTDDHGMTPLHYAACDG
ncbi:ankyrin repeat-containing domain protein, partial [Lasiosphaeria hispida]